MSFAVTTLLQKMTEERAARKERLRLTVREELRSALREILPGTRAGVDVTRRCPCTS
jgi:hypothetical protein